MKPLWLVARRGARRRSWSGGAASSSRRCSSAACSSWSAWRSTAPASSSSRTSSTLLVSLGKTLGAWTYLLVAVMAFFETGAFVGLIAPGETVMLVGGLDRRAGARRRLRAHRDRVGLARSRATSPRCTSGGAWAEASSSSTGRRSRSPRSACTSSRGSSTATAARRSSSGASSGSCGRSRPSWPARAACSLRRFLPYDVIGAGLWTSTFILLGYVFWHSFATLLNYAKTGALALGTSITVVVAVVVAYRWLREEEHRRVLMARIDAELDRPLLRPLAFVLRPDRAAAAAPGALRLEPADPGRARDRAHDAAGDRRRRLVRLRRQRRHPLDRGLRRARPAHADHGARPRPGHGAVDVAKVVTALGSLPAVDRPGAGHLRAPALARRAPAGGRARRSGSS